MALAHEMMVTTGITKVSVAAIGKITASTTWEELFYTLKDSTTISQAAATKTEIKVDQTSTAVGVAYEPGDFTIEWDIPDTAKEILEYFYNKVSTAPYAPSGYEAIGITMDNKITKAMLKFDFASGQSMIITNAEMVPNMDGSSLSTSPVNIHVVATVKAPIGGDNGEAANVIFYNPTVANKTVID